MDKYKEATSFYTEYVKLSDPKKNEFSRLCNKLLNCNYICNRKEKDRSDYYIIINYLSTFKAYFNLMDYELNYYEANNVVGLSNVLNYNHKNLRKMESIILLILRKLYYIKMQEVSLLNDIVVSIEQIHDEILITNIYNKRLTKSELKDSINTLKRFNLVDNVGSLDEDDSVIIIYPTILYVVDINSIEKIDKLLEDLKGKGEAIETVSQDKIN